MHRIALVRMHHDQRTRDYVAKRTKEGNVVDVAGGHLCGENLGLGVKAVAGLGLQRPSTTSMMV